MVVTQGDLLDYFFRLYFPVHLCILHTPIIDVDPGHGYEKQLRMRNRIPPLHGNVHAPQCPQPDQPKILIIFSSRLIRTRPN